MQIRKLAVSALALFVSGLPAVALAAPIRNIVLVHGAFMDGSSWQPVIQRLQRKGYQVSAVQNPLTSLKDDAAATRDVLARQSGDSLLVGFSWGGAVIGELDSEPNVAGLVYIAAIAPDVGESVLDLQKLEPDNAKMPGLKSIIDDGRGHYLLDPAGFANAMAHDIPPELAVTLAATQVPVTIKAFSEPATAAAWRHKPSWYAVSTDDHVLLPSLQWRMAKRIGAQTVAIKSSHASMLSQPDQVVALIERAAQQAARP